MASLQSPDSDTSLKSDNDEDFVPMDDKCTIVSAHRPIAVVHYAYIDHANEKSVPLKRKRGRPRGSQASKNKMKQKKALDTGGSGSDMNDNFTLTDEDLAIVVADDFDAEYFIPLEVVRPRGTCEEQYISTGIPTATGKKVLKSNTSVHGNRGSAMGRAKEFQHKLPAAYPSFVKLMLPSHCEHCFWLGIPAKFYQNHLPNLKTVFELEDEDGKYHRTTYIGDRRAPGLSGGWSRFAVDHDIKVGDAVIFQLVESTKFKAGLVFHFPEVYIVRENELETTDGPLRQQNLKGRKKGTSKEEGNSNQDADATSNIRQSGDRSVVSEDTTDGISFSDYSDIEFDGVTSFSDFSIVVDSLAIDCKFQEHQCKSYYDLCCSQKSYLHKHLLGHLNPTLVVGVIMDIINIAKSIRMGVSPREDFLIWKKTLESFELLGMNVAFMIKRINNLLGLPTLSRDLPECKKYKDLKLKQACAKEKVEALELHLSNAKDALKTMNLDIEEMESSANKSDQTWNELATAPW
ncbi:hypothetical protein PR202_ga27452 [Eleusine coracana subsp. coracana]|uniref:TF-B3 domain-containing protein n=1 Tax=Eleusine coracana subsp. coracana TaxID=191504 RepID=A0AAV5DHP6_ELECO|nr:hypothetical protein PR202_ga27452 [Eleusine coracana subsp. coracana]